MPSTHYRATLTQQNEEGYWVTLHDHPTESPLRLEIPLEEGKQLFADTFSLLRCGMELSLVDATYLPESETVVAPIVVIEPDFLVDISTLAENFKEYGKHPLNLVVNRLQPAVNSRHILLGNIANHFLDALVNETPEAPVEYLTAMHDAFRNSPLAIASCPDLESAQTAATFFEEAHCQFIHLREVVNNLDHLHQIEPQRVILEPSFIAPLLGIQGRLDLLTEDYTAFIELKSGKAREERNESGATLAHRENHYVQMLLYYTVLHYNLQVESEEVSAYLLYSRYPLLYPLPPSLPLVKQALNVRNRLVAVEAEIARRNDPNYTSRILAAIAPQRLNEEQLNNRLWHNYCAPPIERLQEQLRELSPTAQNYVAALYTFITKEQYLSKVSSGDLTTGRGVASLWRESISSKQEAGEIMEQLTLLSNEIEAGVQRLTLQLPEGEYETPPNFRVGDMVMLYRRETPTDSATTQQLFKGSIESLGEKQLLFRMRQVQRNTHILPPTGSYTIEHDYSDTGFTLMYKGIAHLLRANTERRALLLGERLPAVNPCEEQESHLATTVARALAARDYFLLIGPPGTGKTSQALRRMVEGYLEQEEGNILLVAYTNKAVDEICHTLAQLEGAPPFLRIGQEVSCEACFKEHLLANRLASARRRSDVVAELANYRIVVASLTTLSTQLDLFRLQSFGLAVVDEASQILEPQLLPLLCATTPSGENAVGRFILIGDHKQLPSIVLQNEEESRVESPLLREAAITNLRDSLFERLMRLEQQRHGESPSPCVGRLIQQGRMHPAIAAFSARHFYGGALEAIPLPHQCEELPEVHFPPHTLPHRLLSQRIAFVAVERERSGINSYKVNRNEAELTAQICHWVYLQREREGEPFVPEKHLGVIAPYRSQIAAIYKALEQFNLPQLNRITVDTVERFQGGQRDVILFSCCVNTPSQLNELCSVVEEQGVQIDRKLNVALTRARKQLFLVGNPTLLSQNPIYASLLSYIKSEGGVIPHSPLA